MNLEHPFSVKGATSFLVPPLRELLQEFQSRLKGAAAAMTVYGAPESGKTTALRKLRDMRVQAKTAVVFHAVLRASTDERFLIRALLASSGTRQSFYSDMPEMALYTTAQVACDAMNAQRVILFVDKAEFLTKAQLDILSTSIEELGDRGLAPFVCLVGRPEVRRLEAVYKGRLGASDIGPFFVRAHRMRGLAREEVGPALKFLDDTQWPEPGPTYTEHFAPAFWRRGGRLETLGPLFAQEFIQAAKEQGHPVDEIPIGYLNSAVHAFCDAAALKALSSREEEGFVRLGVELSGFADSLELYGDLEGEVTTPPERPRIGRAKRHRV